MKPLLNGLIVLFLLTVSDASFAQMSPGKKTPVFKNISERVPVAVAELEKAFKSKEGTDIRFTFNDMKLKGTVVSSVKRYDNLYSVIVKSESNTLVSFSKRINDDKSVTYVGRILNNESSDGYELKKNTDGTYTFHKISTEDLIQDF